MRQIDLPRLPETPESLASMRRRWADALALVVDAETMLRGENVYIPSKYRRHIFDSEDGLRMIVSRDRIGGGVELVHVSFSCTKKAIRRLRSLEQFLAEARALLQEVSGLRAREAVAISVTKKAVHYWFKAKGD